MTPSPPSTIAVATKQMHYVYILRSLKDHMLYLGWTTDLQRRLWEHNAGLSQATKTRGPFELVYYEAYSHREEAKAREYRLKRSQHALESLKKRIPLTIALASSWSKEGRG